MKIQVSQKFIRENYKNIISVGYCDLSTLLRYKEPIYYTAGLYGWNADIYHITNEIAIVTGYRPFGNIKASYNGICKKYEELSREITKSDLTYNEKQEKIDKLLEKFISEAIEKGVNKNDI